MGSRGTPPGGPSGVPGGPVGPIGPAPPHGPTPQYRGVVPPYVSTQKTCFIY